MNLNNIKIDGTNYILSSPKEIQLRIKNGKIRTLTKYNSTQGHTWLDDRAIKYLVENNNPHLTYAVQEEEKPVGATSLEDIIGENGLPGKPIMNGYFLEPPPRVSPLVMSIVPNPHLDKALLTIEELNEVLAWAAEQTGVAFDPTVIHDVIRTSPESIAAKLIDYLGQFMYGANSYIGPEKTGNIGDASLLEAVTTVPALSDADARARAHDISLSGVNSPGVDSILPPLARAAQIFRPAMSYAPAKTGATNFSLLSKAGDVESNPGPKIELDDKAAQGEADIIQNPFLTNNNYNLVNTDSLDVVYSSVSERTSLMMRAAIDNQSDVLKVDTGLMTYPLYSTLDVPTIGNQGVVVGARVCTYSVLNLHPKEQLKPGVVGANLNASLAGFSEFLALQRTNNNIVQGAADVQIFSRTPNVDYGCWLAASKMLAYECVSAPLSGSYDNLWRTDGLVRAPTGVATVPIADVYPNTLNVAVGAFGILAIAITSEVQAKFLMNEILPANLAPCPPLFDATTAVVICPASLSPGSMAYIALCEMEYPYCDRATQVTGVGLINNAEPVRQLSVGTFPDHRGKHLIQGPRSAVVFVLPSRIDGGFIAVGDPGAPIAVPVWSDPSALCPAPVAITAAFDHVANQFGVSDGQFTPYFTESFTHLARFMDDADWKAAVYFASGLIFDIGGFPTLTHAAAVADSGRFIFNNQSNPILAAQVNTASWDLTAGNLTAVTNQMQRVPTWSAIGVVSGYSLIPAPGSAGGGARLPAPTSAFVNDTPWLTKLGIFRNFYAKKSLSKSTISDLLKANLMPIYMMIEKVALRHAQMYHNYFQDAGITNRMILRRSPMVADRFTMIWDDFFAGLKEFQETLFGYEAIRPIYPEMPLLVGVGAGNVTIPYTGRNYDWWLDSPVYLYNHMENMCDPDDELYYPRPEVAIRLDSTFTNVKPGPTTIAVVFGINTGSASAIQTVGLLNDDMMYKADAKKMWALSKYQPMHNATPYTILYNIFQTADTQTSPLHYRSHYHGSLTPILRWCTQSNLTASYRSICRNVTLLLPFHPPSFDPTSGLSLNISIESVGIYQSMRPCVGLNGMGSATYLSLPLKVPTFQRFGKKKAKEGEAAGGLPANPKN